MEPTSRNPIFGHPTAAKHLAVDTYLTDGQRLLRVVSQPDAESGMFFASLEDCLTLEVRAYSPRELLALGIVRRSQPD
ncbi:MAG TPA: hypothetical protein VIC05_02815 [Solirubrobacteraceae bacterium]|jgi:hypothetical protein